MTHLQIKLQERIATLEQKERQHRVVHYVMFFLLGFVIGMVIAGGGP